MNQNGHRVFRLATRFACQTGSKTRLNDLPRDHISVITPYHFYRMSRIATSTAITKIFLADFTFTPPTIVTDAVSVEHYSGQSEKLLKQLHNQGYDFRQSRDVHACLVNIDGLGVLVTGASGSGKSHLLRQLLECGHIMVADDVVELESTSTGIVGVAPLTTFGMLLVAGQEICSVKRQFGVSSLLVESKIALNIHIACENVAKTQKMTGFDLPQWYIAAPESYLVYQCLEEYRRGT